MVQSPVLYQYGYIILAPSNSISTAHGDAIIRTTVIIDTTKKDHREVANNALVARIVLTGTGEPLIVLVDMDFTRRMVEAQEFA